MEKLDAYDYTLKYLKELKFEIVYDFKFKSFFGHEGDKFFRINDTTIQRDIMFFLGDKHSRALLKRVFICLRIALNGQINEYSGDLRCQK